MQLRHPQGETPSHPRAYWKKASPELHPLDPHLHHAALEIGVIANFGTKCV